MAKDTLKQLDIDIEKMLFAGAQIARTNPELLGAKTKLAPIAAKIPAIRRVTEQIGKIEQATGKAAATELLDLAVLMAQIRSAQASPALPTELGDLTALPPAAKIGSPMLPAELKTVVGALMNAPDSRYRAETIQDAVTRGSARDLRILPLCLPALSDSHIADVVEKQLLPAVGEAIIPELRRSLDIEKGRTLDQRILRAIAAIEGPKAIDTLREAIEKGSADIRSTAIEEFGRIDPVQAEPVATVLVDKDRSKEVKVAAIRALANAPGDAALDALLRAFGGTDEMRAAAESSLTASKHPQATERIMGLWTPELQDLGHYRIKKANTKEEKDEAAKAQKAHAAKVDYMVDLVDLLAARGTDRTMQLVVDTFRTHKIKEVRDTAARSLLRLGYQEAWQELLPALYDSPEATQYQFIDGTFALDMAKAYDRLAPFFETKNLWNQHGIDFATRILVRMSAETTPDGRWASLFTLDPRWVDLAIGQLAAEALRGNALALLVRIRSPKALDPVLSLLREGVPSTHGPILLELLATYKDPRVPPAFIRVLSLLSGAWQYQRACQVFNEYDDPALAPHLRYWLEDRKSRRKMPKSEVDPFENCLRFLVRNRNTLQAADS
jgi:HEAT repeat protein